MGPIISGREPELQGARQKLERHYVYVLADATDPAFAHELLDIVPSMKEARKLAEGWLAAHYPNQWELRGDGMYAQIGGRKDGLLLVTILGRDYYKHLCRQQLKAARVQLMMQRDESGIQRWIRQYLGPMPPRDPGNEQDPVAADWLARSARYPAGSEIVWDDPEYDGESRIVLGCRCGVNFPPGRSHARSCPLWREGTNP